MANSRLKLEVGCLAHETKYDDECIVTRIDGDKIWGFWWGSDNSEVWVDRDHVIVVKSREQVTSSAIDDPICQGGTLFVGVTDKQLAKQRRDLLKTLTDLDVEIAARSRLRRLKIRNLEGRCHCVDDVNCTDAVDM